MKGRLFFDLVATCDRLSSSNLTKCTVSSAWQDEHLKFLGGFIIVLSLRDHNSYANQYDLWSHG